MMKKTTGTWIFLCIVSLIGIALTVASVEKPVVRLPKPHYHQEDSDPAWLQTAVQVHGHLGPAIVVGVRMGAAGRDAVKAHGYFDLEVTATGPFAKPPKSCILDGLQISTGATLGKRNLYVTESEDYLVEVRNKRTGRTATVRPTPELLKLMWSRLEARDSAGDDNHDDEHAEMHRVEALARQILDMPEEKIMTIQVSP